MALYEAWKKEAYEPKSEAEYENFWKEYLPKEQTIYEYILSNRDETVSGTLKELAERFEIDTKTFIGFMDGINSSLVSDYDVEALEALEYLKTIYGGKKEGKSKAVKEVLRVFYKQLNEKKPD